MNLVMDVKQIKEILPHRYPFLLVDKIVFLDLENGKIIGQKNVTINEEFFLGHFPNAPIMPGVLILEALAQTGGVLVYKKEKVSKIALLMNISNAKFRKPVFPGDVLMLHVQTLHSSKKGGKIKAKATVGKEIAVEAELSFVLIEKNQL
ncbi:MAG: 3-hydroxyacyl-ACP dehydratase [Chlamydiae bacterium SM23_39]|nr:MAG: 3-hydroxyacyl-ACP dehydratase [Chlamydiae bacterium SM23_39]